MAVAVALAVAAERECRAAYMAATEEASEMRPPAIAPQGCGTTVSTTGAAALATLTMSGICTSASGKFVARRLVVAF